MVLQQSRTLDPGFSKETFDVAALKWQLDVGGTLVRLVSHR